MAKYVRYRGEFLSRAGIVWRVEILQENANAFPSIGALTFEATEPLVLEWKRTDKEETICGSTATIRLESPGDRTYEDLYSIEVGQIRLDVYRAGYLYWSGALDPEFYEEPYEKARNYPVSLTFSDFGILGRLKYNLAGMQTLQAIVTDAQSAFPKVGFKVSAFVVRAVGSFAFAVTPERLHKESLQKVKAVTQCSVVNIPVPFLHGRKFIFLHQELAAHKVV